MPKAEALQLFEYDRRMYAKGDVLEVEERFVRVLVAVGRIRLLTDAPPQPPAPQSAPPAGDSHEYRTRAMTAQAPEPARARRNRTPIVATARAASRGTA